MAIPAEGLGQAIAAYDTATGRRAMIRTNPHLTPRELDVLASLIAGQANRDIAAELNIRMGTVKSHLHSIYQKLGVSNRTEAATVGVGISPMLRDLSNGAESSPDGATQQIWQTG